MRIELEASLGISEGLTAAQPSPCPESSGEHIKGGIPFHNSFTGKDVVTALVTFLPEHAQSRPTARRVALEVARSLKSQLFLIEVDFDDIPLSDAVDDVFIFLDESEAGGGGFSEMPTGVLTHLSKCYSPSCTGDEQCYAPGCVQQLTLSKIPFALTCASVRRCRCPWKSKPVCAHLSPCLIRVTC